MPRPKDYLRKIVIRPQPHKRGEREWIAGEVVGVITDPAISVRFEDGHTETHVIGSLNFKELTIADNPNVKVKDA